nr:uncharacterized protein LOC109403881 [Aedes albopictus]
MQEKIGDEISCHEQLKQPPYEDDDYGDDMHIEVLDQSEVPTVRRYQHLQRLQREVGPQVQVPGFNFPIADEDAVELLEATVNLNEHVRNDYVSYLRAKKPYNVGIPNVFHTLFSDEAMYSYNYSGICNRGSKRKAMQRYSIFMDCMLEAWRDHGVDEASLKESIYQVIRNINGRKRNRKYFAKRREEDRRRKLTAGKD